MAQVTEDSRAARVLADVLRLLPSPDDDNGHFRLTDSWVEGGAICIVYQGWWHNGTLGLRRQIEAGPSVQQIVGYILVKELGEPPGLLIANVTPDERGITWWGGDAPARREYDQYG